MRLPSYTEVIAAATCGEAEAQCLLGNCDQLGLGVETDLLEAAR